MAIRIPPKAPTTTFGLILRMCVTVASVERPVSGRSTWGAPRVVLVNGWLRAQYGDPCRGCGFDWSVGEGVCASIIDGSPARLATRLAGCEGSERGPGLEWDVGSYVAHLADTVRIWAERVAAAALDAAARVTPYDERGLGDLRGYETLPLRGSFWAHERAVGDWRASVALSGPDTRLLHPQQGPMGTLDVARILAHESRHHEGDVELILAGTSH